MSDEAAAPAAPPAPAPEPPPAAAHQDPQGSAREKYESHDQRQRARDREIDAKLKEAMDADKEPDDAPASKRPKPKPKTDPQEREAAAKPAEPKEGKAEPATARATPPKQAAEPAAPAQPAPPKPDHNEQLQRARAAREHSEALATVERQKREHIAKDQEITKAREQLKRYEEREQARKQNPYEALADAGYSLEDLIKGTNDGRYKPRAPRPPMPPEVEEELRASREFRERFEREKGERQAKEARERDISWMRGVLEQQADQFPIASAIGWAADTIVSNTHAAIKAGKGNDVLPQLQAFEQGIRETTVSLLGNERVVAALIKSKPELRDTLRAALGESTNANPPASNEGGRTTTEKTPRSLGAIPNGSSTRPQRGTPEYLAWEDQQLRAYMTSGGAES